MNLQRCVLQRIEELRGMEDTIYDMMSEVVYEYGTRACATHTSAAILSNNITEVAISDNMVMNKYIRAAHCYWQKRSSSMSKEKDNKTPLTKGESPLIKKEKKIKNKNKKKEKIQTKKDNNVKEDGRDNKYEEQNITHSDRYTEAKVVYEKKVTVESKQFSNTEFDDAGQEARVGLINTWLSAHESICHVDARSDIEGQWLFTSTLESMNCYDAALYSMLVCDTPIQVRMDEARSTDLIVKLVGKIDREDNWNDSWLEVEYEWKKSARITYAKMNIRMNDLKIVLKKSYMDEMKELCWYADRITSWEEDKAAGMVMYMVIMMRYYGVALNVLMALCDSIDTAKSVTLIIKALGLNKHRTCNAMTETQALHGYGIGELNWSQENSFRIDRIKAAEKTVHIGEEELRHAVRHILNEELDKKVHFKEDDAFWQSRWQWCANGAHSDIIETRNNKYNMPARQRIPRIHRKVFAEGLKRNPISEWDGKSYYTTAEKREHGKTRALYCGDSVTYFAFEHILRPVEKQWNNKRVILDPGKGGHAGIVERIMNIKSMSAVSVMLDYDDFNSQHTLLSQAIVIDELIRHTGYDETKGNNLIKSIFNGEIIHNNKVAGKHEATLMSGHRATSFINSILNYAYLITVDRTITQMDTIHVGDDVYIGSNSVKRASGFMKQVQMSDLRINALKQSIGPNTAEFTRIAIDSAQARAYVARSIAGMVTGNWENDIALSTEECMMSMIQHSWTLQVRTQSREVYRLLVPSVTRLTGISKKKAENILSCRYGVNNSPTLGRDYYRREYKVDFEPQRVERERSQYLGGLPAHASRDYLTYGLSPLEVYAVKLANVDMVSRLQESSYAKSLAVQQSGEHKIQKTVRMGRLRVLRIGGAEALGDVIGRELPKGSLERFPVIMMLRKTLSRAQIHELEYRAYNMYDCAIMQGWYDRGDGVMIDGWCSFSDASACRGKTTANIIHTSIPMYI